MTLPRMFLPVPDSVAPTDRPRIAPVKGSSPDADPTGFEVRLSETVLGEHPVMVEVRKAIARAAIHDWPVLITGETGTGKDLVAHAIHAGSARSKKSLHVATMVGLGETAWSVLFGHRKGSFTGATVDHEGVFLEAHESALLLEDICDLPLRLQPMLLRAVERGCFRPLGAKDEVESNVRLLASTNRPLDREVQEGRFRADLYQRLALLKITMPPLRSHIEDLPLYVHHFLRKAVKQGAELKQVSDDALRVMERHPWPRNVRELEYFLYRATVDVPGSVIVGEDVRRLLRPESETISTRRMRRPSRDITHDSIRMMLEETGGNKREAARRLGISPGTMYALLRRLGIS